MRITIGDTKHEVSRATLKETIQQEILQLLTDKRFEAEGYNPLWNIEGEIKGTPEYDAELTKQINRITKLFG